MARSPAGVADEGADDDARLLGSFDGFVGGKSELPVETVVGIPPESGETQLLLGHRAADVDGNVLEVGEGFVPEEMTDVVAGRMIENQAERAVFWRVAGEQDHGSIEESIAQGRVGEDECAFEFDLGVGHFWSDVSPDLGAEKGILRIERSILVEITGREGL